MKRSLLITLASAILLISSIAFSYDEVNVLDWTPYEYENITVTTTAVARPTEALRTVAGALFLTVEDNSIRYRIDGEDPSATNGHLVVSGIYQNLWLNDISAIKSLRMIAIGGSANVKITYYLKRPQH